MNSRPALEGVKVLEFGWALTGPLIGSYLGAFGAEVIKIESSTAPDVCRLSAPYADDRPGVNRSGLFAMGNTNKRSMAIDLSTPEGRSVARRLAMWADVIIQTFPAGMMERWGLAYEELRQDNPGLIVFDSSLLGRNGPSADVRGLGHNMVSLSGYTHLTGWPDRDGVGPAIAYTDFIGPSYGIAAILAALSNRRRTGKGAFLEVSQYEAGVSFIGQVMLDYFANGVESSRDGNRSAESVPHGIYPCRGEDAWCAISVDTDRQWEAFCQVLQDPSLNSAALRQFEFRKAAESDIDRAVIAWTGKRSASETSLVLQKAGIPAGVVATTEDLLENDAHLRQRQAFWTAEHPEVGPHRYCRPVPLLSATPAEHRRAAPDIGQDTEFVCREILNMPDEEFLGLLSRGALK